MGTLVSNKSKLLICFLLTCVVLNAQVYYYKGRAAQSNDKVIKKVPGVDTNIKSELKKLFYLEEATFGGFFDFKTNPCISFSITTIGDSLIENKLYLNYSDMFRSIPGVYNNSTFGEIRNIVFARGFSGPNALDASEGNFYVAFYEDGLPISMGSWSNYGSDHFLRPDMTLKDVEIIRGGYASVTASNSPVGIFNYVSKTGGDKNNGIVRMRYGRQSEKFNYVRTDFNFGGPLGQQGVYYNLGGFYRYDEGTRYNGQDPLNKGFQIKGNVTKKFYGGNILVYAKLLDDNNGWNEYLPAVNFDDPTLVDGISQTDAYRLPSTTVSKIPFNSDRNFFSYKLGNKINNKEFALGMSYVQNLGSGFKLRNNIKISIKNHIWDGSNFNFASRIDDPILTHSITGIIKNPGELLFKDRKTGEVLASGTIKKITLNRPKPVDTMINVYNFNLPGQNILRNGILTGIGVHNMHDITEVMNNFAINKKISELGMSFTFGAFYSMFHMRGKEGTAAFGWAKLQGQPELLDVELISDIDKRVYKFTEPESGLGYLGSGGWRVFETQLTNTAYYIDHAWDMDNDFNLDWSVRYESIRYKGTNFTPASSRNDSIRLRKGLDGNELTQYDNIGSLKYRSDYIYDRTLNLFSFSVGLNYNMSSDMSIYTRYSNSKRPPSLYPFFTNIFNDIGENYKPVAQIIEQFELGLNLKYQKFNLTIIPFYGRLANVGTAAMVQDENGIYYSPLYLNNEVVNRGAEFEFHLPSAYNGFFELNIALVLQNAIVTKFAVWDIRSPSREDDTIINSGKGNEVSSVPQVAFTINPNLHYKGFSTSVTWMHIGSRQANNLNTFELPGFSQFDLGVAYNISENITISYNCNNLLQSKGVMSWTAPSGFGQQPMDRAGFSTAKLKKAQDNNTPFGIMLTPPRSHFVTMIYRF